MATTINQRPFSTSNNGCVLAAGQEIIFGITNNPIVAAQTKVKMVAEVHISSTNQSNLSNFDDLIGTFKTVPNNAGTAIFDLSTTVEDFVLADNLAASTAKYKLDQADGVNVFFPMHLINQFSRNNNAARYLAIKFYTEFLDDDPTSATFKQTITDGTSTTTMSYTILNSYIKYNQELSRDGNDFGFDFTNFIPIDDTNTFLSNAPVTQYATNTDYGTTAFINPKVLGGVPSPSVEEVELIYYASDGSSIGTETVEIDPTSGSSGGYISYSNKVNKQLLYFGVFPGNLRNWSTVFQNLITLGTLAYYTYRLKGGGLARTKLHRIDIICTPIKNYTPIRLAWLNQWGVWDYYTFKMLSSKSIDTRSSTYNQLQGTWNDLSYRNDSFKGGSKTFRVNSTEKIKMNTDLISEAEAVWFEELINSPEIYILEGFQDDLANSLWNNYVTPVTLTTKKYTTKTSANDKIIQYTFEVEKTKTLRTQSI